MLPAQRIKSIFEDIKANGIRSVSDLSQKYEVSEMTVRRDLKQLEDQGLIMRTHGGAVPSSFASEEPQFIQKQVMHEAEKHQIARYAVEQFVRENDIISMEGGTSVASMVAHMAGYQNITVMTHGLHTLVELQRIATGNTIISTGGFLRQVSNTFVGPVAEEHFTTFHANKVFLSATGWTAERGFTDPNMLEIQVKKAMIRSAKQIIMLIDSSKFGVVSLASFLDAFDVDHIVTDKRIPADVYAQFSKRDITVHIAS
ncbi:MAG: DeoR/GlpR transcriptional regulator [Anaerolineales bacterium]|nr:DeoR/GlpR transcriptional regulator [Anaerolineales bacterium]